MGYEFLVKSVESGIIHMYMISLKSYGGYDIIPTEYLVISCLMG